MTIINSNVLVTPNHFIGLLLLCVSCTQQNADKIHDSVVLNSHDLAVLSIVADSIDLWGDSVGVYVKGVGNSSNWQGQKANYFSGKKIQIDLAYYVDGRQVLRQEAGLKVSGGGSRKQPQKSFNIFSDEQFSYPFFKQKQLTDFSHFRLRVSGQDWRETLLRDALMHALVSETAIDAQAYQPVVVYLNGNYWGVYNLREKFNARYLEQNHGVSRCDILERNGKLRKGDTLHYQQMLRFIEKHDLAVDSHYQQVLAWVDTDNFMDYYCAQIYFANTDWPGNNVKYWRPRTETGKWRWFIHDTDLGFGFAPIWGHPGGVEHNTLKYALNDSATMHHNPIWSTFMFRNLLKNTQFKQEFIRKFAQHLQTTFQPKRVHEVIDSLSAVIAPEMPQHIERWKKTAPYALQSMEQWGWQLQELKDFATKRPAIVEKQLQEQFNLKEE
jgi:hypothetical protein